MDNLFNRGGGGGGGGYMLPRSRAFGFDPDAIAASLAEAADLINQAKRLGVIGGYYGGGLSPVKSLEKVSGRLCASMDNLAAELNITAQAVNRLLDAEQRLPAGKSPVVLVKEESGNGFAGSDTASQEDRNSSTSDMSDRVHSDRNGKLTDKVEQ